MSQNQIGFIGAGNMGGALLVGIQAKKPEMSTAAYDILPAACEKAKKLGATVYASIEELVQENRSAHETKESEGWMPSALYSENYCYVLSFNEKE